MQERFNDGSYGEPRPFNQVEMEESLKNPDVEAVEVFRSRPSEMRRRMRLFDESQQAKSRAARKRKNKQSRKTRRNNK